MEFKNNDGCVGPTLHDLKFCIHSCIPSEAVHEYAVGLSKLLQGSTQDVLRVYEQVTLLKDIVIDTRQIADAGYIYKTTVVMVNMVGQLQRS